MSVDGWVSVARSTVMDGPVIDWFPSVWAYERDATYTVSASRDRVLVNAHTFLHTIPQRVLETAHTAHQLLSNRTESGRAAAKAVATHEGDRSGRLFERGTLREVS